VMLLLLKSGSMQTIFMVQCHRFGFDAHLHFSRVSSQDASRLSMKAERVNLHSTCGNSASLVQTKKTATIPAAGQTGICCQNRSTLPFLVERLPATTLSACVPLSSRLVDVADA
jgi:hypothetical protein